MQNNFSLIKDAIAKGEGVSNLRGWVYRYREQKDIVFIVLRDSSGILQLVIDKSKVSKQVYDAAQSLGIESSIEVLGNLRKDERSPQGYELDVSDLKVIGKSENYPISKDFSEEFLLDVRHLWLRSRKMTSMLKIRSTVFNSIHEFYRSRGFYEYHSPILQSVQCEGGSTLFEVPYFEKKGVFLAQTWQLYAEPAIFALEKIYTISPSFRAERSKTARHLTEFWHAEMEAAWMEFTELQDYAEDLLKFVISKVLENNKEDLDNWKRDINKLETAISKPFVRITYDEALNLLKQKYNISIPWGKDLRTIEEDKLSKLFDTFIIITKYPKKVKAFYMKEDPENPDVVLGFDCIAPEAYGEIIGASEREADIDKITKRLIEMGENPQNYEFYLDTRRYGSVPHSGYGMGVERLVAYILGTDSIKDAIPFPRTMIRYKP
ncbi:MAG TPA: asparagine--tRNA ligase [archaeon]|jgi:asparaginyl-tRNA synthetase|nr:asparagine--tRNA ligase [archaeon]HRT03349.1 asparagine--tRNA ligase [Candidatus Diapherotrites archaeon]